MTNPAEPTIGAFYQCYKRPKAVESVLSSFRTFYPNSGIFLICDGGEDFSEMAKKYGCEYRYEAHTGNETNNVFQDPGKLEVWLKRIVTAANHLTEDYMMLLEDDVLILSKISSACEQLKYTLNGVNPGTKLGRRRTLYLKLRGAKIPLFNFNYFWGGFGGCIIERQFILDHFTDELIPKVIAEIDAYTKDKNYTTDIWISLFVLYYGGTLGQYRGFCETWWADYEERRLKGDVEVLHQYKDLY